MKLKTRHSGDSEALTEQRCTRLRLPTAVKIIYIAALACVPIYILFLVSAPFADFFNRYIGSFVRSFLANLTSGIPFSLAEFALLMIPVWIYLVSRVVNRYYGDGWWELVSACVCVCSALAIIFSVFTVGFAPAYRGSTLDQKLGMNRAEVSAEELYGTAIKLSALVNEEAARISYAKNGFSVMPYGLDEMSDKLNEAYSSFCDEYDFVQRLDSNLKPVMLSEAMSYTHITGVYTFFTGEANININFPDYTIPFTGAHELSHQRGIAREDEANFMAFLVCIRSDDTYIRYSAYLSMYEYVSNALYRANPEMYVKAHYTLSANVRAEMAAYGDFYDKYRDSVASDVSEKVNDTFLKLHGTEGTASYGMVVDLAVSYFKER